MRQSTTTLNISIRRWESLSAYRTTLQLSRRKCKQSQRFWTCLVLTQDQLSYSKTLCKIYKGPEDGNLSPTEIQAVTETLKDQQLRSQRGHKESYAYKVIMVLEVKNGEKYQRFKGYKCCKCKANRGLRPELKVWAKNDDTYGITRTQGYTRRPNVNKTNDLIWLSIARIRRLAGEIKGHLDLQAHIHRIGCRDSTSTCIAWGKNMKP